MQVSAEKKLTGSTVGMRASVETSALLRVRPGAGGPGALGVMLVPDSALSLCLGPYVLTPAAAPPRLGRGATCRDGA